MIALLLQSMAKESKISVQAAQAAWDAAHPRGAGDDMGAEGDEDTDAPKPKAKKQKVSKGTAASMSMCSAQLKTAIASLC